jgi:hypothetical protein
VNKKIYKNKEKGRVFYIRRVRGKERKENNGRERSKREQ